VGVATKQTNKKTRLLLYAQLATLKFNIIQLISTEYFKLQKKALVDFKLCYWRLQNCTLRLLSVKTESLSMGLILLQISSFLGLDGSACLLPNVMNARRKKSVSMEKY